VQIQAFAMLRRRPTSVEKLEAWFSNILVRFIKPAARKLGLDWVNWRSLRTSHAVWLKMAGADVKDAQGQMRHSRASTTLDIYQQFVPESQQRVVEKLSSLSSMIN
jgi:integrase